MQQCSAWNHSGNLMYSVHTRKEEINISAAVLRFASSCRDGLGRDTNYSVRDTNYSFRDNNNIVGGDGERNGSSEV
eukprot:15325534-Ditylum_brightwellii.AAC.1